MMKDQSYQKKRYLIFERFFSKIFGLAFTGGRQNFVQYMRNRWTKLYFGFNDMLLTVGTYLLNESLFLKICQEMYVSDGSESL